MTTNASSKIVVKGYLNSYGFCVKKDSLDDKIKKLLLDYFTVTPISDMSMNENEQCSYNIYYEDDTFIVFPKFITDINFKDIAISIKKYKYSHKSIDIKFNGSLREYQMEIIKKVDDKFKSNVNKPKGGIISLSCGGGKCLAYDTKILLYDGTIIPVQNIKVGDLLMGDDSTPRKVLSLAQGKEMMYKVSECINPYVQQQIFTLKNNNDKIRGNMKEVRGHEYVVNESHILSLKDNNLNTIDISVKDYLKIDNCTYKGYRVAIEFNISKMVNDKEPYMYGIETFINGACDGVDLMKHIICGSYNSRMQFIKGLLSQLEPINNFYVYTNTNTNTTIIDDILFIVRSLGIRVYKVINTLYIDKMLMMCHEQYYDITIEKVGYDNYYGFEIDGNRRFVLADLTVTHNTVIAIYLASLLKLKTLIVVHKEFLQDQWIERIKAFTNATVGIIRQKKVEINNDIVVGMAHSISCIEYEDDIFKDFGLVIYDEVHHLGSKMFSKCLLKTSAEYTVGLSATPERQDGMMKVVNWCIGDILYKMKKVYNYRVFVKRIFFSSTNPYYKEKKRWIKGAIRPDHNSMIEIITNTPSRTRLIIKMIDMLKCIGGGRKILILSSRVEHLQTIKKGVDKYIKSANEEHIYNTYFYMGSTKKGERKLAEKDGDIIFATMQLAEEGLDIDKLNTIILTNPIKMEKSINQSIGRILRKDKLDDMQSIPLVIDICDVLSIYQKWANKRESIYEKNEWFIQDFHYNDQYVESSDNDSSLSSNNSQGTISKTTQFISKLFIDLEDDKFIEDNLIKKNDCDDKGGDKGGDGSGDKGGDGGGDGGGVSNIKKIISTYQFGKNKQSFL
jgi:superfamily II DNA or RNA helicase